MVAEYRLRDIFTINVTQLEFCRSPVADEITEETFKELSTRADATEKIQLIVVAVSERDYLGHIQL